MACPHDGRRRRPGLGQRRRRSSLGARPVLGHQREDRLLVERDGDGVVAETLRRLGDGVGDARQRLEVVATQVQHRLGEQGAHPQRRDLRAPIERIREPAHGFGQLSPRAEEPARAGGQLEGHARFLVEGAGERGAEVVHLGVEPRWRLEDDGHPAVRVVTRRLPRVPGPMALHAGRALTGVPRARASAYCRTTSSMPKRAAAPVVSAVTNDLSTSRESTSTTSPTRGDGRRGVEVEATREHGQTTEHHALVVEQEVVAPVEGGGQASADGPDGRRPRRRGRRARRPSGRRAGPPRGGRRAPRPARGRAGSRPAGGRSRRPPEPWRRRARSSATRAAPARRRAGRIRDEPDGRGHRRAPGARATGPARRSHRRCPSGSRLVARMTRSGQRARSSVASGTTASRTCSQLSRMSRIARLES